MAARVDVAIAGGGIVGLATGLKLLERAPGLSVVILEKETEVAAHQTGHNSGVIHSGLYYKPGSEKAKTCVEGRRLLVEFCRRHEIPHEICGKLVVATKESELPALAGLERRAGENGLLGVRTLAPAEFRKIEPHAAGLRALHVPDTGIVDYRAVSAKFAEVIASAGGRVRTAARVTALSSSKSAVRIVAGGEEIEAGLAVNCGGLQSDRLARLDGARPGMRIVPFRGDYHRLVPARAGLVKHLIYPVPDPRFPFLGVHFTRMIGGGAEAGPNAVPALAREGYTRTSFDFRDAWETFTYPGFWRLATRHMGMGLGEIHRAFSKRAFVKALQRLMPDLRGEDLEEGGSGVRAQALLPDGRLEDDFRIVTHGRAIHVLSAPSPAATASLAIGDRIAARVIAMRRD
jgi:(S)-2-hydroxyglutarate dehydrogenase